VADINPTDTTAAQQDAIVADRYDSSRRVADFDAALGKALEAIQSTGWTIPTATLSRAALADGASAATVLQTLAALITDLFNKGILGT